MIGTDLNSDPLPAGFGILAEQLPISSERDIVLKLRLQQQRARAVRGPRVRRHEVQRDHLAVRAHGHEVDDICSF